MGMICRGHNYPYLMAIQTFLEEQGIPVLVQDPPTESATPGGRYLTVPDSDHDRALELLRENVLHLDHRDLTGGI